MVPPGTVADGTPRVDPDLQRWVAQRMVADADLVCRAREDPKTYVEACGRIEAGAWVGKPPGAHCMMQDHLTRASNQPGASTALVLMPVGSAKTTTLRWRITWEVGKNVNLRVLFLEANDAALVKRFEQVRRPHPLQGNGTILDGITDERSRLLAVRGQADVLIDTSDLNIHQLSTRIGEGFSLEQTGRLNVTVMSFGFKYGLPSDADMVADMRFLPNPFWDENLRPFTGVDTQVAEYVTGQPRAQEFLDSYVAALRPVLAGYMAENKRYATIAVGCTGGKHRSVAMATALAAALKNDPELRINVKHRDMGKE